MSLKSFALIVLAVVLTVAAPRLLAHHGPPHDEVDEFDDAVSRVVVPDLGSKISMPALLVTLAGLSAVVVAARKWGIGATPSPVRVRS